MPGIRLVVGLGNPGERYGRTRHNVGFMAVEAFAGDARWRRAPAGDGLCVQVDSAAGPVWAAKPMTYMNASGDFAAAMARFLRIEPGSVLAVLDEIELPLGRLRLRRGGSAGGHNGLDSILARLGTREVPRLRLGIGPRPEGADAAAFVLARFPEAERPALEEALGRAARAIRSCCEGELEAAMNEFNPPSSP